MARVISRTREHERRDKAAAKRQEREARRRVRRAWRERRWAAPGPPVPATCPSASAAPQNGGQSASEAGMVR